MVFSSFYHGQPLFPKWFCDRKLSFCDGSAETSVFYSCFFCGGKFRLFVCRAMNPLFDAALCGSTSIHHTLQFYAKRELVGARPLHLAYARPFGRLKAPLGLSLLRSASQTRTTLFLLCTKSCIVWRKIGVWRNFRWKSIKRKSLKLLGTSRSFRLCFA